MFLTPFQIVRLLLPDEYAYGDPEGGHQGERGQVQEVKLGLKIIRSTFDFI